jgi:hypothetical protein
MLAISKLRWFCGAFWGILVASAAVGAEPPVVAVGSKELELTLKALLADKVDSSLLDMPTDRASTELASDWLGTVLSARLTLLEKQHADSMVVERLQHQGASIVVIEYSAHQQSAVGRLKRLEAIYRALVERFPEHESELQRSLKAQIRKHRSQRALNRPPETHFAVVGINYRCLTDFSLQRCFRGSAMSCLQRVTCFPFFVAGGCL